MDYIYNTYCMLNMLFDKGASYMSAQEITDYQTTKRIFGKNSSGTSVLYDLSHKATKFFNRIYLGNAYNARNFYELQKQNIGLIINCSNDIPHYFQDLFEYRRVGVQDKLRENIFPYLNIIADEIHNYLRKNPKKNVLIHCFMGSSRSATILMAYIIKYKHYSRRDTLNFLREKRELVNINIDFFNQLGDFEDILQNRINY